MSDDSSGGQKPPPGNGSLLGDSDFGDSWLRDFVQAAPSERRPIAGDRLGGRDGRRFELLKELGKGGMGLVYRARDEELDRVVALKFLLPRSESATGWMVTQLRQEARAVAQLNDDNIIRIFDVAEWQAGDGQAHMPFLVMEYLEGESLAALLHREKPGLRRALEIIEGVAAGLAHAHQRHIIHRDLKPSNVFITSEGTVKLLDFGLAHLVAPSRPPVPNSAKEGTPQYMAPEQWRGEGQDERTDLWELGVMMYELLTGELPFSGESLDALKERVISPEPAPSVRQHHPEIPEAVERLVSSALAKEPSRRIPSAVEFLEDLREIKARLGFRTRAVGAVEPQRQHVTLVSCRLAELTPVARRLDAEDFSELEAVFQRTCSEILQQHGGFITLVMGDEVQGCFGYPVAREEDSEHAGHAALQLVRGLPELIRQRVPHLSQVELAVKVGVHTDMVALDPRAATLQGNGLGIQGEAPRIAAWLARQAQPGTVVLSGSSWALVRGVFDAERLAPRTFEGVAGSSTVEFYRLGLERKSVLRFERSLAVRGLLRLVGREREFRWLLELWERARQGHGGVVLLSGEAGIGKSRLLQELHLRADPKASLHLRCQCWKQSNASVLSPLIDLLQHLFREEVIETTTPEHRLRKLTARLDGMGLASHHVQMISAFLSLPVAENPFVEQVLAERQKALLFEALTALLLQAARRSPVLVAVEDLHWADPSTLELLAYAQERIEQAPILFVLSARPEFEPDWPRFPWSHRLTLERLSAERTAALVHEAARDRPLPEETVRQLVAKTDGVPLFVEEMTRMVLERAPASGELPASIPATLHELLLARLDMLPFRQKGLAQLCAVVGRTFTHALLSALTRRSEAALSRDLDELVSAGLLQRQDENSEPGYQFRHALIQDAACQSILRSTRRRYHHQIARVLKEAFPEVAEQKPELLAHHHTDAGEFALAIPYWTQAGIRASRRSANLEAISHLTYALKLLRLMPDADKRKGEELQLLISLGTPLVQVQGYRTPEVEQTYARARELLEEVGEELPRLELSFWGAFAYYFARKEVSLAHELAERLVELGQRHHSRELRVLGYQMMAMDFCTWGRMQEARECTRRAVTCAKFSIEESRVMAVRYWVEPMAAALAYGSIILSPLGETEQAVQYGQDALELATRIGHTHTLATVLSYLAVACQLRRDVSCSLKWADKAIAVSREYGFRVAQTWATIVRSWALSELGQPQLGLEGMQKAIAHWRASGIMAGMTYNLGLLAEIYLKLGQPQEALAVVDEALNVLKVTEEISYAPELYRVRGMALRALGQEQAGRECLLQAIAVAHEQGTFAYERQAQESLRLWSPGEGEPSHAS
ncbi:protein kinase domain-containing protein [Hyalangium versicolor]|uniref:protein kinase domain-containing protein n=1 Tax=Hyalangium versicolor TaxID=2861190 RepID=UPI001CCFA571|nr:protein kinase [Hyalangium versicolor]